MPHPLARCDIFGGAHNRTRMDMGLSDAEVDPLCVNVVGPLLVGVVMNAFGLGMIVVLASAFFQRTFDAGGRRTQQMTLLILVINVVESIILMVGTIETLGAHFGQMDYFLSFHGQVSNLTTPLFGAILIFICEICLAVRCLAFLRALAPEKRVWRWMLRLAFGVGILGAFGMRLGAAGVMWNAESFLDLLSIPGNENAFAALKTGSLVMNGIVDVLLATTMSMECYRAKSNFKGSNQVLQSLITTMIGGGILLVLIQLWAIVLFFVTPASGWSLPPTLILGQAYSVTFFFSILRPRQVQASAAGADPNHHDSVATLNGMMEETTRIDDHHHFRGSQSTPGKWKSLKRWSEATLRVDEEPHAKDGTEGGDEFGVELARPTRPVFAAWGSGMRAEEGSRDFGLGPSPRASIGSSSRTVSAPVVDGSFARRVL